MKPRTQQVQLDDRVHVELAPALQARRPEDGLDWNDLAGSRARARARARDPRAVRTPGVDWHEHLVTTPTGETRVRVYRPQRASAAALPALLWMHGGGFVSGDLERDHELLAAHSVAVGCVVVAVDYHLAPEAPYPAAFDDCCYVLQHIVDDARGLRVDPTRVAVGGRSAGGGLAAALAIHARDVGISLVLQLLLYPMLDDTCSTPSSQEIVDPRTWNRDSAVRAWAAYLGDRAGRNVPATAAPARALDLGGAAPAYVAVGDLDVGRDEAVRYAQKLLTSGVPTELHVYPGAFHGWDLFAPATSVARRLVGECERVVRDAFNGADW